ncbi:MAG TPA: CAP domain-containing protein [Mucilaginibacter sp.]|jgi:uncharacterized protein YkwD|nr:CAP domain-containing protein [Mucilaginibacter sp.]
MKYFIFLCGFVLTLHVSTTYAQAPGTNKFKIKFLALINKIRSVGCDCGATRMPPAPPLVWNDDLEKAAKGHAKDMASRKYFSHTDKDGRDAMERAVDAGYKHNGYQSFTVGENIAEGQMSIEQVTDGWFRSEGHCRNLMNPDFKEVGIWQAGTYWVQDFGGRVEFSPAMKHLIRNGKAHIVNRSMREEHY